MENIRPFKGLRYDPKVAGDYPALLAPPYDVINPEEQEELYKKSENNIVRLILGKKSDKDTQTDNRYTRSAADLKRMLKSGVLKQDKEASIYVLAHRYEAEGVSNTRIGFVARKKIEEFGGSIVPHEKTLSGPKTDRLSLTRACRCNFSQIFGLYTDKEKVSDAILAETVKTEPDSDITTDNGDRHRLWAVTDKEWIKKLSSVLDGKPILIADGHHRYETALNYCKESAKNGNDSDDVKYVMMYLTNTESEGLTILPTNRLIFNLKSFKLESFLKSLSPEFSVEEIVSDSDRRNDGAEEKLSTKMQAASGPAFGLYSGNGKYHFMTYASNAGGGPLDKLDVGVLHSKILEAHLGIGPKELAEQTNVKYSQEMANTAEKVDEENFQLAFFLNPTPVDHMRIVTDAGLKMPQKSTYFYPKLISGLVINPLY